MYEVLYPHVAKTRKSFKGYCGSFPVNPTSVSLRVKQTINIIFNHQTDYK